jgi:hypothetical protein
MEKMTVLMVPMKQDADVQPVRPTCLHAGMESAFHLIGVVTLIVIVLMAVMKRDAVSITYQISSFCDHGHWSSSDTVCTAELLSQKARL